MNKKQQHYIPKSYLKRFSVHKNKIYFYDKEEKTKWVCSNINNLAKERHFYNLPTDCINSGNPQEIEDKFSEQEGVFSNLLGNIISNVEKKEWPFITNEERQSLSCQLVWQALRTRKMRDITNSLIEKNINHVVNSCEGTGLISRPKEIPDGMNLQMKIVDEYKAFPQMKFLFSEPVVMSLIKIFLNYKWIIGVSEKKDDVMITSDHPVAMDNIFRYDNSSQKYFSFGSVGTMVSFPINPSIVLLMYDPESYKKDNSTLDAIYLDSEFIEFLNHIQLQSSRRFLFSKKIVRYRTLKGTPKRIEKLQHEIRERQLSSPQYIPATKFALSMNNETFNK